MKYIFVDSSKNQHKFLKTRTKIVSKSLSKLDPELAENIYDSSRTGPGTKRYSESVLEPKPIEILTR